MRYSLVNIGPNNWFDYKADSFFGVLACCHELGMDIDFRFNDLATDRTNVLVGSDWLIKDEGQNIFTKNGLDYILIEGEFFFNGTLNNKASFNLELYLDYLANAKTILTPFKHNVKEFAKYDIKAQYYRWGDFPGRFNVMKNSRKTHISAYYGLLKGQRKKYFETLSKKFSNNIFLATANNPYKFKDYCLNFSETILSLKCEDVEFVNPIRIVEALANGIPVWHNHSYDPDGYTKFCENLNKIDDATAEDLRIPITKMKEIQDYYRSQRLVDSLNSCEF